MSSLKNLFFMLLNWWLEWWEGGGGAGRSFSLSSSSAALRKRGPAALTNRIAALEKAEGEGGATLEMLQHERHRLLHPMKGHTIRHVVLGR